MNSLYFVHIGDKLPSYANGALELALKFSGLNINLISNEQNRRSVSNESINFLSIEDFYNPEEFNYVSKNISYSSTFRNGFWHKSLERFFVLDQFAKSSRLNSVFHAELDQLLFGTNLLLEKLQKLPQRGIYVPFHTKTAAVASVMYWNDGESLRSLLNFASNNGTFPNEMSLIANWASVNPTKIYGLPTVGSCFNANEIRDPSLFKTIDYKKIGGVVDAAQIGQWLAGIDSRNLNLREPPKNKYSDVPLDALLTRAQLESLNFKVDLDSKSAVIESEFHDDVQIYNLHIHSKIHKWLNKSDRNLKRVFWLANQDFISSVPSSRKIQISAFISNFLVLILSNPKHLFSILRKPFL